MAHRKQKPIYKGNDMFTGTYRRNGEGDLTVSDPRNKTILKMFNLPDIGERSGSGVPNIFNVRADQGWPEPIIEEDTAPDRTRVTLEFDNGMTKKTSEQVNKTSEWDDKTSEQANKTSEWDDKTSEQANKTREETGPLNGETGLHKEETGPFSLRQDFLAGMRACILSNRTQKNIEIILDHSGFDNSFGRADIMRI